MPLFPQLGLGVGLRREHHGDLLRLAKSSPETTPTPIAWLEVISENVMPVSAGWGDPVIQLLERLQQRFPLAFHGVSLSLGSADPLSKTHLQRLRQLCERFKPPLISDHLCWTSQGGHHLHDLMPLPYTQAICRQVSDKIKRVQDLLGQRLLIENVSAYFDYNLSEMPEWAFLAQVSESADCGILLDVNNVYVSALNQGFDPLVYLQALPAKRIGQIHLAGHRQHQDLLIDTHDQPVCDPVWNLYEQALRLFGPISTCLEWDAEIPPLAMLENELNKAAAYRAANVYQSTKPAVQTVSPSDV